MTQSHTKTPRGKTALALLAAVAAVAVVHSLPSGALADHEPVLRVEKTPSGAGTVTGSGIDCGTDCDESFQHWVNCDTGADLEPYCVDSYGQTTLTATPASGYAFYRWTGCLSPSGDRCSVEVRDDMTVTAHFRQAECSDGSDNDADGIVDSEDPDCDSESDDSEADTIGPPLTVTPASIGLTNDTTPTVEFSSTEAGVTYVCRVERRGGSSSYNQENCTSPYTTPPLADGDWTIEVRARDAQNNLSMEGRRVSVDTFAPFVAGVKPWYGATRVSRQANVFAWVSEAMDPDSLNSRTFKLVRKGTTTPIAATISYVGEHPRTQVELDPTKSLRPGATYTATLTTGARDLAGNRLSTSSKRPPTRWGPCPCPRTWSFTVRP